MSHPLIHVNLTCRVFVNGRQVSGPPLSRWQWLRYRANRFLHRGWR
jgi:hypothetical protein